tara:strand:- start:266 stop:496 length:231 start_codon:yes stop_codon:yes gene_type:complete
VPNDDPIELSLHSKFASEKVRRTIKECSDLETLRQIAEQLLDLHDKKSAIAIWASRRAAEAERTSLRHSANLSDFQ